MFLENESEKLRAEASLLEAAALDSCYGSILMCFFPSFGDDRDLHVLGKTQNLRKDTPISHKLPARAPWADQKYLCDSFAARKIHHHGGGRSALQDPRFDLKVPGKIQMLLNCLPFNTGQISTRRSRRRRPRNIPPEDSPPPFSHAGSASRSLAQR